MLGETNFHTWVIPRSGSKAKDGEKIIIAKVGNNNGQLRIANATKAVWANKRTTMYLRKLLPACPLKACIAGNNYR